MSTKRSKDGALGSVLGGALLLTAALVLPGCSSGNCPGATVDTVAATCTPVVLPTPTPLPTPKPAYVVASGVGLALPAGFIGSRAFSTMEAGTLTVTVDWTLSSNDVDALLARGSCTPDQFNTDQCQIVTFSVSTTAKPEKLTAPGLSAGAYTLLIGNAGPDDESLAFQVVLQPGAAGTASRAQDSAKLAQKIRAYRNAIELPQR